MVQPAENFEIPRIVEGTIIPAELKKKRKYIYRSCCVFYWKDVETQKAT